MGQARLLLLLVLVPSEVDNQLWPQTAVIVIRPHCVRTSLSVARIE
jgi:hypothetical protein